MKLKIILLPLCFFVLMKFSFGQFGLNEQMTELGKAIPSYYHAYTKSIFTELGSTMAIGNQMQHWDGDWKIKYSFSISGQYFSHNMLNGGTINYNDLYQSESISYFGELNNVYGNDNNSFMRHYLLNSEGERIINPLTGEYVSTDIDLVGGFDRGATVIPFLIPSVEARLWKGLIISAGYFPISAMLSEFEVDGFKTQIELYGFGASIHLRYFTKIPVLSWLRFDYSQNGALANFSELQDALNLAPSPLFTLDLKEFNLETRIRSNQIRASIMIPTVKNILLVGQAGLHSESYQFDFTYKIDVKVDSEAIRDEYGFDVNEDNIAISDEFKAGADISNQYFYSAGLFYNGKVSSVFMGYAFSKYPTGCIRVGLKLL
ncbi:MAG: hypothetical protein JXQ87_06960 [Bacteroidia bacterium]